MSTIDIEQVYKAWQAVGADIAGLKWEDFVKHLPAQQSAERVEPDYAWSTVADYEKDMGFAVNDTFKMAWGMARTTNNFLNQLAGATSSQRTWVGLTDEEAQKTFMEHNCAISTDLAGILARAIEAKLKAKNFA